MPHPSNTKIKYLLLVTLVITLGVLMYSVDLFFGDASCTLSCLSPIDWIVLAIPLLGTIGCTVLLGLLPGVLDPEEFEQHLHGSAWWFLLILCLLMVILGLNFFLVPSYQPGIELSSNFSMYIETLQPLAALAIVFGGAGIVILLIIYSAKQPSVVWAFGTVVRVSLFLAAAVFAGQYLLSLLWGAIFYLF